MSFPAQVYRIFIASPSDVAEERSIVREIVEEWNVLNAARRRIVLLAVGWETHAVPQMGIPPQDHINETVLKDCDMLVAIFWSRVGTNAGRGKTGTEEEIKTHLSDDKPARLYFCTRDVPYDSNPTQLAKVKKLKEDIMKNRMGLFAEYKDVGSFRNAFRLHLSSEMNRLEDPPARIDSTTIFADADEKVMVRFTARSHRTRPCEGEHFEEEFSWKELFILLAPMISAKKFSANLKEALQTEILRRLQTSGVQTKYESDFSFVDVPESEFARITYQFEQLGYVSHNLTGLEFTESGLLVARKWAAVSGIKSG